MGDQELYSTESLQTYSFPSNQTPTIGWVGQASSTTQTYTTISHYGSPGSMNLYNNLISQPVEDFINHLFHDNEIKEWLRENGYSETDRKGFNEHVRMRLKGVLLAPKQKLTIKIPKSE